MSSSAGKSSRQLVLEQLHAHKSHELVPRSGKVVAFDLDLSLRHALDALAEHHIGFAPLWDSAQQEFVTVLGGEDFARLLAYVGREAAHGGGAPLGRSPDDISLRDVLRTSRVAAPPPTFPSLLPDETLFAAVQAMLDRALYHLPLVDTGHSPSPASAAASAVTAAAEGVSSSGGAGATIVHVLTPLRVLNCIVNSPMFQSDTVRRSLPPTAGPLRSRSARWRALCRSGWSRTCAAHPPPPAARSPSLRTASLLPRPHLVPRTRCRALLAGARRSAPLASGSSTWACAPC